MPVQSEAKELIQPVVCLFSNKSGHDKYLKDLIAHPNPLSLKSNTIKFPED